MRLIATLDAPLLPGALRDRLLSLVRGAGLEPKDVRNVCQLMCDDDGRYELHGSELLSNEGGRRYLDPATNMAASRPVVIEISEQDALALTTHYMAPPSD